MPVLNKSLKVLILSNSIFVFAASLLGPLYAIFVGEIDEKVISVSFSWFVYMASSAFFTFLAARYGDKVRKKEYLLVGGFLVRGVVWLFFIFTSSLQMLLVLQFFVGLGEALGTPAFDTIYASHLEQGKFMTDYSAWKLAEKISIATAALAGGAIVASVGFAPLFGLMFLLAMGASVIVLLQPKRLL